MDHLEKKIKNWHREIRSWRDRNLKFGPNCDLEVDDLEKNQKFGEAINFH